MSDIECFQRISVLETNQLELMKDIDTHATREEAHMTRTNEMLTVILSEQASMKGFWTGIVFAMSAVFAAVGLAVGLITNKMFGS